MRLIDADTAIKDAELNYGEVCSVQLMKYFLEKQPTLEISARNLEGCIFCNNEHCSTCIYAVSPGYNLCHKCSPENREYEPYNYCPHCGKYLALGERL